MVKIIRFQLYTSHRNERKMQLIFCVTLFLWTGKTMAIKSNYGVPLLLNVFSMCIWGGVWVENDKLEYLIQCGNQFCPSECGSHRYLEWNICPFVLTDRNNLRAMRVPLLLHIIPKVLYVNRAVIFIFSWMILKSLIN